jgi:phosphohistidine swiveling domain-containing protein
MSHDMQFDIRPNGDKVRVEVHGPGLPAAGQVFNRELLKLPFEEVNQLRRGKAPDTLVQQVRATISQWLLADGLGLLLGSQLGQHDEPLRLIFNVDEELRADFSELPIELLTLQGSSTPLALHPKIGSFVHLLPKVGTAPIAPTSNAWPLRVLVVRSSPQDLPAAVPSAALVLDAIQGTPDLPVEWVHIEILSREQLPGVIGLPTPSELFETLKQSYDILIYLGHGDVQPSHQGLPPLGVLQLESEDGLRRDSLPADKLAVLLHNHPVPVVLLIGCLTAVDIDPPDPEAATRQALLEEELPAWMRGSLGVAQALVNSESGVQIAVGMQYWLEKKDAERFVEEFFASLLRDKPGHVETAIRQARVRLHIASPQIQSWSAPVLFRALGSEPMFPFLAQSPGPRCPPSDVNERSQIYRDTFWKHLSKQPADQAAISIFIETLDRLDQDLVRQFLKASALIMPDRGLTTQPNATVTIPIKLHQPVKVTSLEGRFVVGGTNVTIQSLKVSQGLTDSGYRALFDVRDSQADFEIRRKNGDSPLPEGVLFNATLTLGSMDPAVYVIGIEAISTEPELSVCAGNNAIIVLKPATGGSGGSGDGAPVAGPGAMPAATGSGGSGSGEGALALDAVAQRLADLNTSIRETWDLINQYEQLRRLSDNPRERLRAERAITDLRTQLKEYEQEYQKLQQG